ncbi:hypothetical protein [Janthinobacterium sp. LB2P10]|uniref:hypothetical protein n=1 Tax=Janthinobacterium sp. LB2P10 TaxID=3424194 RepID=UPI003F51EA27
MELFLLINYRKLTCARCNYLAARNGRGARESVAQYGVRGQRAPFCTCTTVTAVTLNTSSALQPRDKSWAGLRWPVLACIGTNTKLD